LTPKPLSHKISYVKSESESYAIPPRPESAGDIVKRFMKNGTTYETTEAAEKNSVSSKRPPQQRSERTPGCLEKRYRSFLGID